MPRSFTFFLVTALSFGFLVGFWYGSFTQTIALGIFSGLVAGGIFGGVLTLVALFFIKTFRLSTAARTSLFVAEGLVGAGIGCLVLVQSLYFPTGEWQRIAPPPSKPVRILGVSPEIRVVYVRAIDGSLYPCSIETPDFSTCQLSDLVPERVSEIQKQPLSEAACKPAAALTQKGALKVIDSCEFDFLYIDVTIQIEIALLEDGSLWRWIPNGGWLFALLFPLSGLVIAIAASSVFWGKWNWGNNLVEV